MLPERHGRNGTFRISDEFAAVGVDENDADDDWMSINISRRIAIIHRGNRFRRH